MDKKSAWLSLWNCMESRELIEDVALVFISLSLFLLFLGELHSNRWSCIKNWIRNQQVERWENQSKKELRADKCVRCALYSSEIEIKFFSTIHSVQSAKKCVKFLSFLNSKSRCHLRLTNNRPSTIWKIFAINTLTFISKRIITFWRNFCVIVIGMHKVPVKPFYIFTIWRLECHFIAVSISNVFNVTFHPIA